MTIAFYWKKWYGRFAAELVIQTEKINLLIGGYLIMKKYLKLMALTATLCMAMSVVIPTPSTKDTTTEETTTSDASPFSNMDVPPIKQ